MSNSFIFSKKPSYQTTPLSPTKNHTTSTTINQVQNNRNLLSTPTQKTSSQTLTKPKYVPKFGVKHFLNLLDIENGSSKHSSSKNYPQSNLKNSASVRLLKPNQESEPNRSKNLLIVQKLPTPKKGDLNGFNNRSWNISDPRHIHKEDVKSFSPNKPSLLSEISQDMQRSFDETRLLSLCSSQKSLNKSVFSREKKIPELKLYSEEVGDSPNVVKVTPMKLSQQTLKRLEARRKQYHWREEDSEKSNSQAMSFSETTLKVSSFKPERTNQLEKSNKSKNSQPKNARESFDIQSYFSSKKEKGNRTIHAEKEIENNSLNIKQTSNKVIKQEEERKRSQGSKDRHSMESSNLSDQTNNVSLQNINEKSTAKINQQNIHINQTKTVSLPAVQLEKKNNPNNVLIDNSSNEFETLKNSSKNFMLSPEQEEIIKNTDLSFDLEGSSQFTKSPSAKPSPMTWKVFLEGLEAKENGVSSFRESSNLISPLKGTDNENKRAKSVVFFDEDSNNEGKGNKNRSNRFLIPPINILQRSKSLRPELEESFLDSKSDVSRFVEVVQENPEFVDLLQKINKNKEVSGGQFLLTLEEELLLKDIIDYITYKESPEGALSSKRKGSDNMLESENSPSEKTFQRSKKPGFVRTFSNNRSELLRLESMGDSFSDIKEIQLEENDKVLNNLDQIDEKEDTPMLGNRGIEINIQGLIENHDVNSAEATGTFGTKQTHLQELHVSGPRTNRPSIDMKASNPNMKVLTPSFTLGTIPTSPKVLSLETGANGNLVTPILSPSFNPNPEEEQTRTVIEVSGEGTPSSNIFQAMKNNVDSNVSYLQHYNSDLYTMVTPILDSTLGPPPPLSELLDGTYKLKQKDNLQRPENFNTNRPAFLSELIARKRPEEENETSRRPAFLNELIARRNPNPTETQTYSSDQLSRPRPAFLAELNSRFKGQVGPGAQGSNITGEVKKKLKTVFIEKMNPENLKDTIYEE